MATSTGEDDDKDHLDPAEIEPPLESSTLLEGADPEPITELDKIKNRDAEQDILLKRWLAGVALGAMLAQIAAADYVFIEYGRGMDWHLPTTAIDAWLAAAVIQVIGIVLVIARYLFPSKPPSE